MDVVQHHPQQRQEGRNRCRRPTCLDDRLERMERAVVADVQWVVRRMHFLSARVERLERVSEEGWRELVRMEDSIGRLEGAVNRSLARMEQRLRVEIGELLDTIEWLEAQLARVRMADDELKDLLRALLVPLV